MCKYLRILPHVLGAGIIAITPSAVLCAAGTNLGAYDITTARQVEVADVKARLDLDSYGGSRSIKGRATGWFSLQQIKDRWWLVTPDGNSMISLGVTHILAACALPLFDAAYHRDFTAFTRDAAENLRRWGFNSAGYGGVNKQNRQAMLNEMPAVVSLELLEISRYSKNPERIDLFDGTVRRDLARSIAEYVEPVKGLKNLIGYMYVDLPQWWNLELRRKGNDWPFAYRRLAAGAPGKIRYVDFLLERRKTVAAVNEAYGTIVADRAGLLAERAWANLRPDDQSVMDDDRAFVAVLVREYYKFCHDEIRKLDPQHLIFGDRYASVDLGLEDVIKEAVPYIDGVAIQPIPIKGMAARFDKAAFDRIAELTGKPILICDFAVNFATPQFPSGMWGSWPTEDAAADLWAHYLDDAFAQPNMVGIHRCEYIDLPVAMPQGNVLKQGLVQQDGRPYVRTVQRYAGIHKKLYERIYGVETEGEK